MLDQVISSGVESIDADTVRDLLGLAEMESVDRFIAALTSNDALDGLRLLDELERDGRDLVAFADQVVARLREQLIGAMSAGPSNAASTARLARAARRLAGLDINRGAAGGYRLQLELAVLEGSSDQAPNEKVQARPADVRPVVAQPAPPGRDVPAPAQRAIPIEPDPVVVPAEVEPHEAPVQPAVIEPIPVVAPSSGSTLSSSAAEPDDALAALLTAWPEVTAHISKNLALKPLITACRPVEVRDATVILGFPESQAFLRDIAERKRPLLEQGIAEILGRPVNVRCVATNIEIAPPAAAVSDQDLVAQAKRIFEGELLDVAEVD